MIKSLNRVDVDRLHSKCSKTGKDCASVMKEPSTLSFPLCRVKVASSIMTLTLMPGAEKKL